MSLSDDPLSPTKKNQAPTSQEPRERLQDFPFSSSSKETEKKSQTNMSQETQEAYVAPMNRDEEALKSLYESFWEPPNYYDSDNITINTRSLLNPSGGMLGGSLDSVGNMASRSYSYGGMLEGSFINHITNNKNNNGQSYLNVAAPELHNPGSQTGGLRTGMQQQMSNSSVDGNIHHSRMQGERYGSNSSDPLGYQSNIFLGSGENNASMTMSSKRDRNQNVMDSNPGVFNSNTSNSGYNDQSNLSVEAFTNNGTFSTAPMMQNIVGQYSPMLHNHGNLYGDVASDGTMKYTRNTDIKNFRQHLGIQGERYGKKSSEPFPYHNFSSGGNIASTGFVKSNNGQSYQAYDNSFDAPNMQEQYSTMLHNYGNCSVAETSVGTSESFQSMSRTNSSPQQPQWTIKKKLSKSDVSRDCRRLLLTKSSVLQHIQKHIPEADFQKVVDPRQSGLTVNVYDHDKLTTHEMCLTLQRDYVLTGGWVNAFVERRKLKEGDHIGLMWDSSASRLQFSVLSRAIANSAAEAKKKL